jgi:hypothetical protein
MNLRDRRQPSPPACEPAFDGQASVSDVDCCLVKTDPQLPPLFS